MCVLASGIVLYRWSEEIPLFLLLESARHGTWGFPKGHVETGENLETAALRECAEESGLTPEPLVPGFHKETRHTCFEPDPGRVVDKKTTYYLAHTGSGRVALSGEHDRHVWEPRLEARKRLQYDNLRELLDCAHTAALGTRGLLPEDLTVARKFLHSHAPPDVIWRRHCEKVADTARRIGEAILAAQPELPVDLDHLEAAALLHDIGRSKDHGVEHPREGLRMLLAGGLDHLAKPCVSHWLKGRKVDALRENPYFTPERLAGLLEALDLNSFTLSEEIIAAADSLVQHDQLVRLEERYREVRKRYGDSPWIRENEAMSAESIEKIETLMGSALYSLLEI